MIITIDGPAASGKSTVARQLAQQLGIVYLGTGYLYRAAAYVLYRDKEPIMRSFTHEELQQLTLLEYRYDNDQVDVCLHGESLYEKMQTMLFNDRCASLVGVDPAVRSAIVTLCKQFVADHQTPGVIADGRDCGTVMFPKATVKFFLTATPRVRAERIIADGTRQHKPSTLEAIEEALIERDKRDSTRAVAPLQPAHDACVIDTSTLSLEQTVALLMRIIQRTCK